MAENLYINVPKTPKETMPLPDPDLLQYYQDVENRVIWLIDAIGGNVYAIIQQIIQYNRDDKNIEDPYNRKPIRLVIASPGGSVNDMHALMSVMEISDTPIITIAMGQVSSAAAEIFLCGHKRLALKNTCFLFHEGSCADLTGSHAELAAFMENYNKEVKESTDFYKRKTKFDAETIESKMKQGDWYIRLDEALQNGVIDEIIEDINIFL